MSLRLRRLADDVSYGEGVYAALKDAIVEHRMRPGERLREDDLAAHFKVSRTPVREALKRLQSDHLVVRRAGRGLIVTELSGGEIIETYLLREVLEGLAARLAARRVSETDLVRLDATLRQVEAAIRARNADRAADLSVAFEAELFRIAGSPRLSRMITELRASHGRRGRRHPGRLAQALREHRAVLAAVKRRDPEGAERAAREHMKRARDVLIRMSVESCPTLAAV